MDVWKKGEYVNPDPSFLTSIFAWSHIHYIQIPNSFLHFMHRARKIHTSLDLILGFSRFHLLNPLSLPVSSSGGPSPLHCLQHLADGHVVLFAVHTSSLQHFSSGKYGEFPPPLQSDVLNSFTFLVMLVFSLPYLYRVMCIILCIYSWFWCWIINYLIYGYVNHIILMSDFSDLVFRFVFIYFSIFTAY